jgi:DNA-binding MarR family transcriptional regulator
MNKVSQRPASGAGSSVEVDDAEITLGLLTSVDRDESVTQRRLANDLGIALGLTNAYIKRAAKKGLIKISQAPTKRYAYYLTPKGFSEKSRLTAEFLSQSFKLFRLARQQYSTLLAESAGRTCSRIAVYGTDDLVEIVLVCAQDFPVKVVGAVAPNSAHPGVTCVSKAEDLAPFDTLVIADLVDPQAAYDRMAALFGHDRVVAPAFLNISRWSEKSGS